MMIALYLVPKIFTAYLLAFILFRFFDILKPSIIYRAQDLDYGIGIMIDDVIAAIYSIILILILKYLLL